MPTNGVNKFTQGIYKNDETSTSHSESQRNKIGDLHRRYSLFGQIKRRVGDTHERGNRVVDQVGVSDQLGEVSSDAFTDNRVFGNDNQLKRNDISNSQGKGVSTLNTTIYNADSRDNKVTTGDKTRSYYYPANASKIAGKINIYGTGSNTSLIEDTSHATMQKQPLAFGLGRSNYPYKSSSLRDRLVAKKYNKLEWSNYHPAIARCFWHQTHQNTVGEE